MRASSEDIHIANLKADCAKLLEVVKTCALRFREYETAHAAKGSIDGDVKARRNAEMAELCERAISEASF